MSLAERLLKARALEERAGSEGERAAAAAAVARLVKRAAESAGTDGPRREGPGPLVMPVRERKEPKGLKRGKPIAKRNPERLAKRRAETFSDCARMARLLPCAVCDRAPPSDPAHVVSRGAGGKDWANVWPACRKHHDLQHQIGTAALEARFGISLAVVASYVADMVREHECYEWPKLGRGGRALCAVCLAVLDPEALTP